VSGIKYIGSSNIDVSVIAVGLVRANPAATLQLGIEINSSVQILTYGTVKCRDDIYIQIISSSILRLLQNDTISVSCLSNVNNVNTGFISSGTPTITINISQVD
jgi:hypothetical protein